MTANTVYLITGANRGLGHGLVSSYLSRPNTTVIATIRDTENPALTAPLTALPVGASSELILIKLESTKDSDFPAAIETIEKKHGIAQIDVVIASAAVNADFLPVASTSVDTIKTYMEINTYGPLRLFQAVLPLLEKAKNPKFVFLGSPIASLSMVERTALVPMTPYACSKVVVHWLSRKIHLEHANIISLVCDPGFVQTDMGNNFARTFGMKEAVTTVADSVKFLVKTIDEATKTDTSGHFPSLEGGDLAW
ncbi:putative aflatoxin biosynthesis ketoreductase nor-1 [Bisporella sp. PMI_857]|nr:putative aflatoxin biosynthesis ketoreductase nor-1 [Bisporella sp. PMI_857]